MKVPVVSFDPNLFERMKSEEAVHGPFQAKYESTGEEFMRRRRLSLWRSIYSRIKNPTKYDKFLSTIKQFVQNKFT